jgi:hypothetical protein
MLRALREGEEPRTVKEQHAGLITSIIQTAFDPVTTGAGPTWWVGESGILVVLTTVVVAVIFSRGC